MYVILGAPFRTHIKHLLRTIGFMDVRSCMSYISCMMYKFLNDIIPCYLKDLFKYVNSVHSLSTRQSKASNLYIPKCNTNYGKNMGWPHP